MKLLSPQSTKVPKSDRRLLWLFLGCGFIAELVARLGAETLWFQEVGYLKLFWLRLATQGLLGGCGLMISAAYLLGNLWYAQQLKSVSSHKLPSQSPYPIALDIDRQPRIQELSTALSLFWLLPLTLCLSLFVSIIVIYYGQVAIGQGPIDPDLLNITAPAPLLFRVEMIWQVIGQLLSQGWISLLVIGLMLAILIYPRLLLRTISVMLSGAIGWICSQQWMKVLPFFAPTRFDRQDPVFGADLSNYIFGLPVGELVEFGLMGVCLFGLLAVMLTYLLAGNSLSQGRFPGFSSQQQRQLVGMGGCLFLVIAVSDWLSCYELLYSPRGVSYGASYTDITVQLPACGALSIIALVIAIYLWWRTIYWQHKLSHIRPILVVIGLYFGFKLFTSTILPTIVQSLLVQPNELARETPYIQRTITATRQAFGLENIETKTFDPQANLTEQKIQANNSTIRNIRLWDKQPLLATNRQLQQIRLYYRFPDADIDRYTLTSPLQLLPPTAAQQIASPLPQQQQVLIAARELDYTSVPKPAQTWVNEHLIYTHGYGFTLNPVNRVAPDGLPEYFVKDIGSGADGALTTSSPTVRSSIPIGKPRIYYGENANTYIMTGTNVKELDYPSGDENVYTSYDGKGGIKIGAPWQRLLFATYLHDWRMLFTPEFRSETKILFRRNLNQRIRSIAPFLSYDHDPYLVAANPTTTSDPSQLYWIVDAYTTSDRYPYSDIGKEGINYIRNSVKIVVDAYHGSVSFYIADPHDPIITTWAKIFPDLFKPLSAMPANLRQHLRYPQDFLKIQSERLMTYHMTDPQVFYSREDRWQVPTEVYGDKPRLVEPYYLITRLPHLPTEEFILFLPYTPQQRTNLVAWLAARSDQENYGKLLLYTFPKQKLIYGPEQIEARINQDPVISQQISLWNRQGSSVLQGNLLIVPIEQSLLYVEPLYLQATQNQLPTLVRVIVAYENRIVMAPTLQQALTAIF